MLDAARGATATSRQGGQGWRVGRGGGRGAPGDSLVYANFALNAGANRAWEFAARSEEEAREWVRAIDGILFKQSKKASRVVKC